jgi:tetratricopeptide (TPR) repeat protein
LNLATTSQQYLHDDKTALENYHAYLALTPHPANWDEVNALAGSLEAAAAEKLMAETALAERQERPVPSTAEAKPPVKSYYSSTTPHQASTLKPQPVVKTAAANPPPVRSVPVQVVQVRPEPPMATAPPATPATTAPSEPASLFVPMPIPPPKESVWHKLFGSPKQDDASANTKYLGDGLTPLPSGDGTPGQTAAQPAPPKAQPAPVSLESMPAPTPAAVAPPPAPVFPRYHYFAPRKPVAGNRTAAVGAFTQARLLEQDEKWPDALQCYQQAAAFDPAWFEAQYNTGVLAHRLRNFALALPHYELALAIQPDSADARYNFALALWASGYAPDAAEELIKIITANPGEVRAHLALANISAQALHETGLAREQYVGHPLLALVKSGLTGAILARISLVIGRRQITFET